MLSQEILKDLESLSKYELLDLIITCFQPCGPHPGPEETGLNVKKIAGLRRIQTTGMTTEQICKALKSKIPKRARGSGSQIHAPTKVSEWFRDGTIVIENVSVKPRSPAPMDHLHTSIVWKDTPILEVAFNSIKFANDKSPPTTRFWGTRYLESEKYDPDTMIRLLKENGIPESMEYKFREVFEDQLSAEIFDYVYDHEEMVAKTPPAGKTKHGNRYYTVYTRADGSKFIKVKGKRIDI